MKIRRELAFAGVIERKGRRWAIARDPYGFLELAAELTEEEDDPWQVLREYDHLHRPSAYACGEWLGCMLMEDSWEKMQAEEKQL